MDSVIEESSIRLFLLCQKSNKGDDLMDGLAICSAIDVGNDSVKAYFGEDHQFTLPNCMAEYAESRHIIDLEKAPAEGLHVYIKSEGLSRKEIVCVVGELAQKVRGNQEPVPSIFKCENDQTLIMILVSHALDAAIRSMGSDPGIIEADYVVSTGLPISEQGKDHRAMFKDKIIKHSHEVKFLDTPILGGITVKLNFCNALVSSEGFAAYLNLAMDTKGQITDHGLLRNTVMIVDIGSLTTDIAVIEKSSVDNQNSRGIILGVADCMNKIIEELNTQYQYRVKSRKEMVNIILENEGKIYVRGRETDIKDIITENINILARKIYMEISRTWDDVPNIYKTFIIGGGAVLLKSALEEINQSMHDGILCFQENSDESVWMIANAYRRALEMQG